MEPQYNYKETFLSKLLLHTPVWLGGYWPFKQLIIKYVVNPWENFLKTRPEEELPLVPSDEIWKLLKKKMNDAKQGINE